MATLISEFDDPPGAAQRPEEPPAVDLAAAAATGDVEALRRAFEAQLAAQEQRHAAELRAAALGDTKVPLLGATKRLLAEADAMRASRTRGADDGSDDEDVFAGPTSNEEAPPADVAPRPAVLAPPAARRVPRLAAALGFEVAVLSGPLEWPQSQNFGGAPRGASSPRRSSSLAHSLKNTLRRTSSFLPNESSYLTLL